MDGQPLVETSVCLPHVCGRTSSTDVQPRFWKWYVDDTCTALPASRVQEFLEHLNSVEPSIRFTVEVESNGQLPFPDVLLRHDPDGSIATSVYRKPTHTDRYLDFSSHHPLAHKIAVVRTLHTRAESINSSVLGKDEGTRHLKQALTSNGYPKTLIHPPPLNGVQIQGGGSG